MTAQTMGGVRVHVITPRVLPAANRGRVLMHVHGGCYVLSPGEAGTIEAILMAGIGQYKVISVDYRMPPEAYFPAALDDAVAVYREMTKTVNPRRIAVFGTSAGGALTLETMLKLKELKLPMPGAIGVGTPMADATKTGDSEGIAMCCYGSQNVKTIHERARRSSRKRALRTLVLTNRIPEAMASRSLRTCSRS